LSLSHIKAHSTTVVVYIVLVVLILVSSLTSDVFPTFRNATNLVRQAVALGIVSIGQTLVLLTAGIDLSVGSVISLTTCLTTGLILGREHLVVPVISLVILVALFIGFCNGIIIVKTRVSPLIVTLAMMSVVQGAVFMYTKGPIGELPGSFYFLAWGKVGAIPFPGFILAGVVAVGILVQTRTRFGRYLYAIGGNEEIARRSGIDADRVKIATYMICSFTAAVTGIYLASRMGQGDPLAGERYMIDSIIPPVLGGTSLVGGKGGIVGTIAGIFILTIVSNIFNLLDVETYWQWVMTGFIVIIAVAFCGKAKT
jgi:ribose/xylose/arabinose/galactoside ABC-type transport system permease subunit